MLFQWISYEKIIIFSFPLVVCYWEENLFQGSKLKSLLQGIRGKWRQNDPVFQNPLISLDLFMKGFFISILRQVQMSSNLIPTQVNKSKANKSVVTHGSCQLLRFLLHHQTGLIAIGLASRWDIYFSFWYDSLSIA